VLLMNWWCFTAGFDVVDVLVVFVLGCCSWCLPWRWIGAAASTLSSTPAGWRLRPQPRRPHLSAASTTILLCELNRLTFLLYVSNMCYGDAPVWMMISSKHLRWYWLG
jgi:hypothetical protein